MEKFDYESKIWGGAEVRLSPFYLGASRLKFALEDLKNVKGRVLEVGCGAGGMAKALKFYRPDLEIYGIDLSKGAIAEAKRDPQEVKFSLGNAYKLPFEDQSFDAVLMFDLLEHLDDPLKALGEAYRVLKPEGIFSAFTPIEGNIFSIHGLARKLFAFSPKKKYGGHLQEYTLSELRALFLEAGFKLLRKRYFGHFFNQLVDFSYFTLLFLRGKNVPYSIEGYLERKKGLKRNLIALVKSLVALVSYLESEIFWFFPASGVHLSAKKPPQEENFFDEHPGLYPWPDLLVKVGFSKNYKPRDLKFKDYLDLLGMKKGEKVLDVGCGEGILLARIAKTYGVDSTGADISKKSIAVARRWETSRLHFEVGDAAQLPFKNESFDYVLTFDVLEHIKDQSKAVAEMVRVLKPRGSLLVYTINRNRRYTWNFCLDKLGVDVCERVGHDPDLFPDPRLIREELERMGVEVERSELFNSFFTLAADEAMMVFLLGLKHLNFFDPSSRFKILAGKVFLNLAHLFSRLLLTPLEALEAPWKRSGYSNSFFILGRKR